MAAPPQATARRAFKPPLLRALPAHAEPAPKRQRISPPVEQGSDDDLEIIDTRPSTALKNTKKTVLSDADDGSSNDDSSEDDDYDHEAELYDALFDELERSQQAARAPKIASTSKLRIVLKRPKQPASSTHQAEAGSSTRLASPLAAPAASTSTSPLKAQPSIQRIPLVMPRKSSLDDGPFFICQWRKPQARKHKTWDGDALLIVHAGGTTCTLRCLESQRDLATRTKYCYSTRVMAGEQLAIAGYDIELDREISLSTYLQGPPYDTKDTRTASTSSRSPLAALPAKSFTAPKMNRPRQQPIYPAVSRPTTTSTAYADYENCDADDDYDLSAGRDESPTKPVVARRKSPKKGKAVSQDSTEPDASLIDKLARAAPTKTFYSGLESPERSQSPAGSRPKGLLNPGLGKEPKPRFDPNAEGALVMPRPNEAHQKLFNRKGLPVVDVVIDPVLGNQLRPHQREGVTFLYECMMGMRGDTQATGAILADEMGLGKTLQTITLISTLLRQSCYYTSNPQTIQRALIVCPLTLVKNWNREFRKWTGNTISVMCIDGENKDSVAKFAYSKTHQVLVIGYERLRTCIDVLAQAQPPIGLIVCDEGHRLKSKQTQTTKMFEGLDTARRIILSGTPIQNDLLEFFAMFDFVVPGHLGQPNVFKSVFADPIMKSRVKGASKEAVELGKARTEALTQVTHQYILRRTADILDLYLPPKLEVVVHVSPTPLQLELYRKVLKSQMVADVIRGDSAQHLALIGILRRLCNTPEMLLKDLVEQGGESTITREILGDSIELFPNPSLTYDYTLSGKLTALMRILKQVYEKTSDKVVLVSNFTTTLDILEGVLRKERYSFCRLDGKTKQRDRMDIVNDFNRQSATKCFAFLLSAKSGGVGLNLIGANRLILLDSDWNPSSDRQAMARIHRDGQKKACYIYRMLTAGTMDEKIFLRQLSKIGLSDALMKEGGASSSKKDSDSFSVEDLKDIFRLHTDTPCLSHDLLECACRGNGELPKTSQAGGAASAEPGGLDRAKDDEDEDESDEEEEEESRGREGFMLALQHVINEASKMERRQERNSHGPGHAHRRRRRQALSSLNDWAHYDCTESANLAELADGILKGLVEGQGLGLGQGRAATPSPLTSSPPPPLLQGSTRSDADAGAERKGETAWMASLEKGKKKTPSSELVAALERISQEEREGGRRQGGRRAFDVHRVEPGSILFAYAKSVVRASKLGGGGGGGGGREGGDGPADDQEEGEEEGGSVGPG